MDCSILLRLSKIEFFGLELLIVLTEADINLQGLECLFVDSVFSQEVSIKPGEID